jgi:hypothetical protein
MQVRYFGVGSLIWKRVAVDKKSTINQTRECTNHPATQKMDHVAFCRFWISPINVAVPKKRKQLQGGLASM